MLFFLSFPKNHTQTPNTEPNNCSLPRTMNTHTHKNTYNKYVHKLIHTDTLLDRIRPFLELSTQKMMTKKL